MNLPPLDSLDQWIADREASVPGIKPGVAAGIVWATPSPPQKTKLSVVYLPGYTATRGEIAPVPDRVAQGLGANLYYARLTGHGVGPDGHRRCTADDWWADAQEAWAVGQALGDQVILMGTSTGATLAILLNLELGCRPAATVLVSPNLGPKNRASELLALPGREWLLKALVGESTGFVPENDLVKRFWDYEHHSHSLIPMMELVRRARRRDFSRWPSPALVVYDPQDSTVEEAITARKFRRAPGVTQVLWTTADGEHNHVLAGEALSPTGTPRLVTLVLEFLAQAGV